MYWFIPKARVPIKSAAIAGVFVAIVFELMKHLFGTVMANFTSYEAIYGAFAALPIFLLWIYLSWNLILLGVEISYTLTIFETEEVYPRHPLLSLLDMLNLIYTHHLNGEAVSEQALRNVLGRKELPKWYTYINYLQDSNLITMTDDDDYVLKRDLSRMTLWDFYRTLPYPLPIKDELDEMKSEAQKPWLSLLVKRFEKTEAYAKQQLHLPLNAIFANSEPRKQSISKHDDGSKLFRKTPDASKNAPRHDKLDGHSESAYNSNDANLESSPHLEPMAYDKDSDIEYDDHDNEAIIPLGTSDNHSDTDMIRHAHKNAIITEADNPKAHRSE